MTKHGISPVALLIACLASLVAASSAQAAQEHPFVKASSYPVKFEGSGGAGSIVAGSNEISCSEGTAKGEVAAGGEGGSGAVTFTGCASAGVKCKTEGAKSGEVSVSGTAHFVSIAAGRLAGLLVLGSATKTLCGVVTILSTGSLLADLPSLVPGKAVKTSESVSVEAKGSAGKQEFSTCEFPTSVCGEGPFTIKSEFVEGKPEETVVTGSASAKFTQEITPEF